MEANPWEVIEKYRYELVLLIIGIVVFFNMLFNGFVWDDIVFIVNNDVTHSVNLSVLLGHNIFNSSAFFRPLAAVYYALVYTTFHAATFPFHVFQLGLHLINVLLVFMLFKRFFPKLTSLFLALIFLVHPIQVESVSYIAIIDEPLFFFFGVVGFLLISKEHLSSKIYLVSFFCFLLTLLAKETGILWIILSIIYVGLYYKQRVWTVTLLNFSSIIAYCCIRILSVGFSFSSFHNSPIALLPFSFRTHSFPLIAWYYLKTFLFPVNLAIDQQWTVTTLTINSFFVPLVCTLFFSVFLLLIGYRIFQKQKKLFPVFLFFGIWFLLGIMFLLQLFPLDMTVADRWFYFPMGGMLGILGSIIVFFQKQIRRIVPIICIMSIVLLSIRTIIRNSNWLTPFTLYSHDARVTQSFDIENNLASEYEQQGNHLQALVHEKKSVLLFPGEINQINLAVLYERQGKFSLAKDYFLRSFNATITKNNEDRHAPTSYVAFASFLSARESPQEALIFTHEGLEEYPRLANLWMYQAIAEYRLGQYNNAKKDIEESYALYPDAQGAYLLQQITKKNPIEITDTYDGKPVIFIYQ